MFVLKPYQKIRRSGGSNIEIILFLACLIIFILLLVLFAALAKNFLADKPPGQDGTSGAGGTLNKDCIEEANSKAKDYVATVNAAAAKYGQDPAFMLAQLEAESNFNPSAQSDIRDPNTGAIVDHAQGIAQFIPGTWASFGQDGNNNGTKDPFEAEDGIYAQAAYNKHLQTYLGNLATKENIIAAYNAGPGAVQRYGGIPPYSETQNYVIKVMSFYNKYKPCINPQNISGGVMDKKCVVYYNQIASGLDGWGCASSSIAMLTKTYGYDVDPNKVAQCAGEGHGLDSTGTGIDCAKRLTGNNNWKSASSWEEIETQVKNGNPVAVGTTFSNDSGHWMVITGFAENGDVIVNDPYGNHGDKWDGNLNGNGYISVDGVSGMGVTYDRQDFRKHFDFDGNAGYSIYLKNPPEKPCIQPAATNIGNAKFFPLPAGRNSSNNFGVSRAEFGRWHAGVDIYAPRGTPVYSIGDGTIVNYYQFTGGTNSSYNTTQCIFVDYGDYVVNYGEVEGIASGLSIGSRVTAGQQIGTVGNVETGPGKQMLHFEQYTRGTTQNAQWLIGQPQPSNLINPTNLLNALQNRVGR